MTHSITVKAWGIRVFSSGEVGYQSVKGAGASQVMNGNGDMDFEEINSLLTSEFDLVPDSAERGNGKTYFLGVVDWRPSSTTRIVRILYGQNKDVSRVKRLVSSDNNNSVFVLEPLTSAGLRDEVAKEIQLFLRTKKAA